MIFHESTNSDFTHKHTCTIYSPTSTEHKTVTGVDGFFIGREDEEFVILEASGLNLKLYTLKTHQETQSLDFVNANMKRLFKTPFNDSRIIMFFDDFNHRLIYSSPSKPIQVDERKQLNVDTSETIIQVVWQPHAAGEHVAAVLTTTRVLIVSASFQILTEHTESPASFPPITSLVWLEWALLFTSNSQIRYMTLDGASETLASFDVDEPIVACILPDRIIFAHRESGKPDTIVSQISFGLLEPLIAALLVPPKPIDAETLRTKLALVVSRFHFTRVSEALLAKLLQSGFPDLAFSLAEHSTDYSMEYKWNIAYGSMMYDKAFRVGLKALPSDETFRPKLKNLLQVVRDDPELATKISTLLGEPAPTPSLVSSTSSISSVTSVDTNDSAISPRSWTPTPKIKISMRMGNEFLSPLNLSGSRTNNLELSNSVGSPMKISPSTVLGSPVPSPSPSNAFPRKAGMSQKLSTKTSSSSTSSIRRSPSQENIHKRVEPKEVIPQPEQPFRPVLFFGSDGQRKCERPTNFKIA